jgi:GR25 family glycosyltransferase involved in LPS biosynthesis
MYDITLEKNKSTYKLDKFGPIYYINLDDQPERREYMESQFKYWEIDDYTRISAYDGRNDDLSDIIKGKYPENVSTSELGCLTSHLKSIKHWYDTSDTPYAIFMEDDCIINNAKYWNFTWQEFICRVPYNWDCLQLAVICTGDIHLQIHNHQANEFSTACFVLTRHYAKKLLDLHYRKNHYKLDQDIRPRAVADDVLYNSGVTYTVPLFLYELKLGSTIHENHVETFHKNSYDGLYAFWKNKGSELTVETITDYNPYFNRIIGSTQEAK